MSIFEHSTSKYGIYSTLRKSDTFRERRRVRYFPVPDNDMCCGLWFALSVIVSVPVCFVAELGVNVTEILQEEPGASVAGIRGQSLV